MITFDSEKILTLGNEEDDRMSVYDKACIEKNEGYQLSDLKYCTFDDINMDDQLKSDISYENLINDFKSTRDVLIHYRSIYSNLLVLNPHNIIYSFKKYKLNFINFNINAFLLLRQLDLMSYVLKLKFEHSDDISFEFETNFLNTKISNEYLEIVKNEYYNKSIDDLILQWTGDENLKKIIFEEVDEISEIRETFSKGIEYEKFILSFIDKNKYSPSICGIGVLIKYLKMILERSICNIEILSNSITEEIMLDFFQDCCKVELLCMMLHNTFRVPQNDIFNLKESSPEWTKLKKNYERIVVHSSFTIKKKMKNLFDMLEVGNAAVSTGFKYESNYLKILGTGYFLAYYFFNSKHANIEVKKFSINPKFEVAHRMWNLLDTTGIKQLYRQSLINIKYRKKLYVKRNMKKITKEYIAELLDNRKNKKHEVMNNLLQSHYYSDQEINGCKESVGSSVFKEKISKEEEKDFVKIKLLHNRDIFISKLKSFTLFDCCINKVNFTRNSLIIHIHGGGWVAMSSSSHENYLRRWSKELDCPLISIDYRLAPECPYPGSLDDVWQAYNWIIDHASEEFDIELNKIILVGDSAGGNLALGLIQLIMAHNKRMPDALFLAYPGMRLNMDYFQPSYLLALQDKILPYHFLQFCLESYLNGYKKDDDSFLEPILMDDNTLRRFPTVRIVCGSSDPLRDDIINFTYKLTALDKDVKCYEFKYFPHGFLNYDHPHMLPESAIGNDIMIREMDKILSSIYN